MVVDSNEIPDPEISWESPNIIGYTIGGEPVLAAGMSCELSFSLPAELDLFVFWYSLLGQRVTVTMPGPDGCITTMAGYVSRIRQRVRGGVADGVDVTLEYLNPIVGI